MIGGVVIEARAPDTFHLAFQDLEALQEVWEMSSFIIRFEPSFGPYPER